MNSRLRLAFAICVLAVHSAFGQAILPSDGDYLKLLRATRFVENYKQAAELSAQVFAARGQGTDVEYAQAMGKVAKADLSSADLCIVSVYSTQGFSRDEVAEVVSIFVSPLGAKVLSASQNSYLESIKKLSVQPMPTGMFSEAERRELATIYQRPSLRKYAAMSTNQATAKSMLQCIFKAAGVQ